MTPVAVIHFPIILENSGPNLDDKIPRWNLRRAKWDEFKNSYILKLRSDANNTDDDNITYFSKTLISIAEESIPKHLLIKNISHGSMVIAKLQSDHAKRLYENSIYIQLPIILIILKYIGQKPVE